MRNIYIGTSGFNYKSWIERFYPQSITQKDWLNFYSNQFQTVEINATFYRHFERKTFESWYQKSRSNFLFSIKGTRYITHIKRLKNIEEELFIFENSIEGLKEKLAVVLWQFPASFKNTEINFQLLSNFLRMRKSYNQVVELRHESWFVDNLYSMLNTNHIGFVINDTQAFATAEAITGNIVYIRFHGPTALYASSYTDEQLFYWAEKIKVYAKKCDVFCYFNNDVSGFAVLNAKKLTELVTN